jgi:hypothetical protein
MIESTRVEGGCLKREGEKATEKVGAFASPNALAQISWPWHDASRRPAFSALSSRANRHRLEHHGEHRQQ